MGLNPRVPLPEEPSKVSELEARDTALYTTLATTKDYALESDPARDTFSSIYTDFKKQAYSQAADIAIADYQNQQEVSNKRAVIDLVESTEIEYMEKIDVTNRYLQGLPISDDLREKYAEDITGINVEDAPTYEDYQDFVAQNFNTLKEIREREKRIAEENEVNVNLVEHFALNIAAGWNLMAAIPSFINQQVVQTGGRGVMHELQNNYTNWKEMQDIGAEKALISPGGSLYSEWIEAKEKGEDFNWALALDWRLDPWIQQQAPEVQEAWDNTLANLAMKGIHHVIQGTASFMSDVAGGQKEAWETSILSILAVSPVKTALRPRKAYTARMKKIEESLGTTELNRVVKAETKKLNEIKDKKSLEYIEQERLVTIARIRHLESEIIANRHFVNKHNLGVKGYGTLTKKQKASIERSRKALREKIKQQNKLAETLYKQEKARKKSEKEHIKKEKDNIEYGHTKYSKGRYVPAFRNRETGVIKVDKEYILDSFKDKPWMDPKVEGVLALPEKIFKDAKEWLEFNVMHEIGHSIHKRKPKESKSAYENRINDFALEQMGKKVEAPKTSFKVIDGKIIFYKEGGRPIPNGRIKGESINPLGAAADSATFNKPLTAKQAWEAIKDGTGTIAEIFGINVSRLMDEQFGAEIGRIRKETVDMSTHTGRSAYESQVLIDQTLIRDLQLDNIPAIERVMSLDKVLEQNNKNLHIDMSASNIKLLLDSIEGTFTFKPSANTYWTNLRDAKRALKEHTKELKKHFPKSEAVPYITDKNGNPLKILQEQNIKEGFFEIRWDHKFYQDPLLDQGKNKAIETVNAPKTHFMGFDATTFAQSKIGNYIFSPGRIYAGWFEKGRMLLGLKADRTYSILTQKLQQNLAGVLNDKQRKIFFDLVNEAERAQKEIYSKTEIQSFIDQKYTGEGGLYVSPKELNTLYETHQLWRIANDYSWRILNLQRTRDLTNRGFVNTLFDEISQTSTKYHIKEKAFEEKDFKSLLDTYEIQHGNRPIYIEGGVEKIRYSELFKMPFKVWDFDLNTSVQVRAMYDKQAGVIREVNADGAFTGRTFFLLEKEKKFTPLETYNWGVAGGNYSIKPNPTMTVPKIPGHTQKRNLGHFFVDIMPLEMTINGSRVKYDPRLPKEGGNLRAYKILEEHARAEAVGRTLQEAKEFADHLQRYDGRFPSQGYIALIREAKESFRDTMDIQRVAQEISNASLERGSPLLGHLKGKAELQDPFMTLQQSVKGMSKYSAWAKWRNKAELAFIRDFKEFLEPDRKSGEYTYPTSPDQIQIKETRTPEVDAKHKAAIGAYERYRSIERNENVLTDIIHGILYRFSSIFESGVIWKNYAKSDFMRSLSSGIKDLANKSGAIEALPRKLTSTAFIALAAPFRHWFLQPQIFFEMLVLSKDPKIAVTTLRSMPGLITSILFEGSREFAPHAKAIREFAYKTSGLKRKEIDTIIRDVKASGMLESIDANMMITNLYAEGYSKLQYGSLEKLYQGLEAPYKTIVKTSKTAGFTIGELTNRLGLWLTMRELKKKEGKDVSSKRVLDEISKESLEISGGMTEAGAYKYQHLPVLNLLTQFASISHKLTMMLFQDSATVLSMKQRASLAAFRMAWYGPKYGLPLGIGIWLNEILKGLDSDKAQEFAVLMDKGGGADLIYNSILSAATGDDVEAIFSMTLNPYGSEKGGFVYDYIESMVGLMTGMASEDARYPSSAFYGRVGDAIKELSTMWRIDDTYVSNLEKLKMSAISIARISSGWNNVSKAHIILATGDKFSKLGQPYGLHPTVGEAWAQAIGFITVKEVEMWAMAQAISDQTKRNKQMAQDMFKFVMDSGKMEEGDAMEAMNQVVNILKDNPYFSESDLYSIQRHFFDLDRKHFIEQKESLINNVFLRHSEKYHKYDGTAKAFIKHLRDTETQKRWNFMKGIDEELFKLPEQSGEK